jgi:NADP-dependent 3-hydroxy acid dehydrogenase YdfG
MPGTAIYGASKRGLKAACDSLRLELAPAGVNVTCVMPGMFETEGLTLDGIVIDGDVPPSDFPLFTEGTGPVAPDAVANAIAYVLSLDEGVAINELVVRPAGELNP